MAAEPPQSVLAQHIESTPGTCGGKPRVAGTRIRVWDIHVWHDLHGLAPEEIVVQYPQLSLADVHAALAYYLDHREDIQRQMREAEKLAADLAAKQGPTKYTQLRDAILQGKQANGEDPVSSG